MIVKQYTIALFCRIKTVFVIVSGGDLHNCSDFFEKADD